MSDVSNALTEFRNGLESHDADARREAARQLALLGPDAREAAVDLARACGDEDDEVREWAGGALEELGPPLPQDQPALLTLLSDPSADVAYWGATLLGRLAQEAAGSATALLTALQNRAEPEVRQRIVWALGELGNPIAVDPLRKLANESDDARLARLANTAMENLGG